MSWAVTETSSVESARRRGSSMSRRRDIVIVVQPATVNMTGVGFFTYGKRYARAAREVEGTVESGFDPVVYQLYCQAVELFLKAFIWLSDGKTQQQIKAEYRHDIEKLWRHSKDRGLGKYLSLTPLRDQIISLVGPYYRDRRFAYFDLGMIAGGYSGIQSERRALQTLKRLSARLEAALRKPVLSKS